MPRVTLRTETADRQEVTITEYICDVPDCPNIAEHVLGFARELRALAIVCAPHKRLLDEKNNR
jgi:hypothetical protein